jgi:hypothetical protein
MDGLALTEEQAVKLTQLKQIVEEDDQAVLSPPCEAQCEGCPGATPLSTRVMTDEQLTAHLQLHAWDVRKAAYNVLVYKARGSDISLPSGLRLPDQSAHYLRLAALQRPSRSGMLLRVDEPTRGN